MKLFKKNVWLIFYVLLFCITILFLYISYMKYENVYTRYQNSQENIIQIISNATQSVFATHEKLMDIIGVSLLEDEYLEKNSTNIEKHIKPLLNDSAVGAFGITKPNGDFIYGSTRKDPKKIKNILSFKQNKASFLKTLASNEMIFGRTYFSKGAQLWSIPLRKAFKDKTGKPIAVMTTLLKPDIIFAHLIQNIKNNNDFTLFVLRGDDLYFQYHSKADENKTLYTIPLSQNFLDVVYEKANTHYHLSKKELKQREQIISLLFTDENQKCYLTTLKFNKKYNLWTVAQIPLKDIRAHFLTTFIIYFSLYFICSFLFFLLFKFIAKAEKKRQKDLIHQATHDILTSLPNRNYLLENTASIFQGNNSFSLLYIDMDNFKNINDSFGHDLGDKVLIEIASRLRSSCPKGTIITRHGGDEFLAITSITNEKMLLNFASSLIATLSKPYQIKELMFNIGASIGIALYPKDGKNLDILLRSADIALYESKKTKNSIHFFSNSMQKGFLQNIHMEQALRNALSSTEIFLVYQPQIDQNGNLFGVEALVRWNSPELGFIPPDRFIPLAEATGLMPKLGKIILQKACSQIKKIQDEQSKKFQLSVNISLRQFMEASFYEHLVKTIEETKISSVALTLEITESLFAEDMHYLIPLLEQIRSLGIEISIDDFGTGYSSLNLLRKLPIDELKIDKTFVDDIQTDTISYKIVQNIINIGKIFDMRILAEGVETKEQRDLLVDLGCGYFQGYYFAKPLTYKDLELFLHSYSK